MTSLSTIPEPLLLKSQTAVTLQRQLAGLGLDLRTARRIQAAVVREGGSVPDALPEVSGKLLKNIQSATHIPQLKILEEKTSPADGFTKYLFQGEGKQPFETVRIPLLHRPGDEKYIVCVSSQVGCAMGCAFCATGRLGFQRNLSVWEMVDQVMQVKRLAPHPVRGVVFMGMGEPFLNYERVIEAAQILSEPVGLSIAAKAITISTVGIVPMIRRFTREKQPFRLIVSLTSADTTKRQSLFPIEKHYPLPELIDAVKEYQEANKGKRITLAWTMISGVNVGEEDAKQLASLLGGMRMQLDLIDVNDATGKFHPPTALEYNRFRDALSKELGMPVIRRYSGGKDINGACGMLAGSGKPHELESRL